MRYIKFIISFSAMVLTIYSLQAQKDQAIEDSLSLDPSIRFGRLKNGFTYYIKPVSGTDEKVIMELILKAGSRQQDIDQFDMAHFIEHLAFARTQNFTNILKDTDLLQELQMQASDIGGKTGDRKTYYWFNYPTGNSKALSKGLLFFQDIVSGKVEFQNRDIDGERGAFFQEYLYGNGQSWYKEWKVTSLLSECLKNPKKPEDYQDYLQGFDVKPLKRFYKDWYRPDLMAISIIGDIKDVDAVEREIIASFSQIPLSSSKRKMTDCAEEYLKRPKQFVAFEDVEENSKKLKSPFYFQFFLRDNEVHQENSQDLEHKTNKDLFVDMLQHRLKEAQKGYNIPYTMYCHNDFAVPAVRINVKALKSEAKKGIQKAFSVYYNIRKNGFSKKEFEKLKSEKIKRCEKTDTNNPLYWKGQIHQHFVHREPLPEHKPLKLKEYLENLSQEDFNDWVRHFLPELPEDVALIVPKGANSQLYSEEDIRDWIKESEDNPEEYLPSTTPSHLISPEKLSQLTSSIPERRGKDKIGGTEYVLENGLKLILKPFVPNRGRYQNKVMIHGFRPEGASCFPVEHYFSAIMSPGITKHSGVGSWDKFELRDFLRNTSLPAGLRPYITLRETGIKGEVELKDLETALQLIFLYMSKPRLDKEAFLDWQKEEEQNIQKSSARAQLQRFVQEEIESPAAEKREMGIKGIDLVNAHQIYRALMENPERFTFIVTGNYSLTNVLPLLTKYLGNLPHTGDKACSSTSQTKPLPLPIRPMERIYRPSTNIENAHIYKKYIKVIDSPSNFEEEIESRLLASIVNLKLKELRYEKKRAVYLAMATSGINRELGHHFVNIMVSCGKEDLSVVQNDLVEIVASLKTGEVEDGLFYEAMASIIPEYTNVQNNNKQVMKALYQHYRFEVPFLKNSQVDQVLKSIRMDDIPKIAKKYLKEEYLMEFVAKNDTES